MGNSPSRAGGGSVQRVIVETTLAPGPAQAFGGGDPWAPAVGAQPDKIYVHATLVAVTDSGKRVTTGDPVMGRWVGRFDGDSASRTGEVEWHIRTMLGLSDHRPPRLSWERLIEHLAGNGISVTEAHLMALPSRSTSIPNSPASWASKANRASDDHRSLLEHRVESRA